MRRKNLMNRIISIIVATAMLTGSAGQALGESEVGYIEEPHYQVADELGGIDEDLFEGEEHELSGEDNPFDEQEIGDDDFGGAGLEDDNGLGLTDDTTPEVDYSVAQRTLQAELSDAVVLDSSGDASESVDKVTKFWKQYYDRDLWPTLEGGVFEDGDAGFADSEVPLTIEVDGMLPGNIKAVAEFVEYESEEVYSEEALMSIELELEDENGAAYKPESDLTVTIGGRVVRDALDEGQSLLLYRFKEDEDREDPKKPDDYKATARVWRDFSEEDGKTDEEIKKIRDRLFYKEHRKEDDVILKEDQDGLKVNKSEDSFSFTLKNASSDLIVTALQPERTLMDSSWDGALSWTVTGPFSEDSTVDVYEVDTAHYAPGLSETAQVYQAWELIATSEAAGEYTPDYPMDIEITDVALGELTAEDTALQLWFVDPAAREAQPVSSDKVNFAGDTVRIKEAPFGVYVVTHDTGVAPTITSDGEDEDEDTGLIFDEESENGEQQAGSIGSLFGEEETEAQTEAQQDGSIGALFEEETEETQDGSIGALFEEETEAQTEAQQPGSIGDLFVDENETEAASEPATEPADIELIEVVTEQASESMTELLTEQATEEVTEEVTEQAAEETTEEVTEQISETLTEQNTEQADEELTEQISEQAESGNNQTWQTLEATADNAETTVTIEGILPEDTKAGIKRIDGQGEDASLEEAPMLAVNIALTDNTDEQAEVQPEESVNVAITDTSIQDALEGGYELSLWEVDSEGVVATPVEGAVFEEDTVSFETDNLASYVVTKKVVEQTVTTSDGQTYRISVSYDNETGIPENAVLTVSEVTGTEYEDYLAQTADALEVSSEQITFARGFDISFTDPETGEEYQPLKPVSVSIELVDAPEMEDGSNTQIVHFGEETTVIEPEVGEGEAEDETEDDSVVGASEVFTENAEETTIPELGGTTLAFATEGFSVFMVVQTVKEQVLEASDGNTYEIKVEYDSTSGIPADAELEVTELLEGTPEYDAYVAKTAETLGKVPEDLSFAKAFDIKLTDPETGERYQPDKDVKVSVRLMDQDVEAEEKISVVHFEKKGEEGSESDGFSVYDDQTNGFSVYDEGSFDGFSVYEIPCQMANGTVEFETDGFSVYVLTGYTVDFHWGEYTYSIKGESEIKLSELFEKLGVTEIALADVIDASFSNPELVEVTKIDGNEEQIADWLLKSLAPFNTEESLKLALNNGESVEIKVTDEGEGNGGTDTGNGTDTFTITWKNADGTVLETDENVEAGTTPTYDGEIPTKAADETGKYYFVGWTPEIEAVSADTEYTAQFENCIPLTITAGSATKNFDGTALTNDSYTNTALADGDTIESVEFHNTMTTAGSTNNTPSNAKIVNVSGEDVTNRYDITYVPGLLTVWDENAVEIELTEFNGDVASYTITINSVDAVYNNGFPLTLKASFNDEEKKPDGEIIYNKQSIDYSSIRIVSKSTETSTYDYSGNTGTYSIPDSNAVTITYNTRVKGDAGDVVKFYSTVELGFWTEAGEFISGPSVKKEEVKTIAPTGTDTSGTGGVYTLDLYVYADKHMETGLEGAVFRMLDSNKQPMTYKAGENAGKEITFTTGEDGHVLITLNEADHGLSIHKNTVYFLEMITAPFEIKDGKYIYYRRDNTFYNFLISDDPSYQYGKIYTYFNGDTMKVRCYPEGAGVNVTKRFSGNYTLDEDQEKAIEFVLQEETLDTASGWTDVEEHPYSDFEWGTLSFDTAKNRELKANTTYRVIERNTLPEELAGTIEWNQYHSISYQGNNGQPIELDSNEFFVDSENDRSVSFNLVYTNEYVEHKLIIISIDEYSGQSLKGAEFKVYAKDGTDVIAAYTTDENGSLTIRQNDGGGYTPGILYYAVQTKAADGYLLPTNPERIYFYFTNENTSPDEIPEGATNLTASYNTVTVANNSNTVNIPVTVVWGNKGSEPWPDAVDHIVIGLYQSAGGAPATPVIKDGVPLTVTLTKEKYYDNSSLKGFLPAENDDEQLITYSVVEEGIYADADGNSDISVQFADSSSVSGTGWYVVKNESAVSVTVEKLWYELDGTTPVASTDSKEPVTFDLYRTITEIEPPEEGSFTRAELADALKNAVRIRRGEQLRKGEDGNWKTTINSLIEKDTSGNSYYYYVLENPVPDNQEDSYFVVPSNTEEGTNRTLTIKNTQTPYTVTISVGDCVKYYGDDDPAFDLRATVKQPDEVDISSSIQGEDGNYTVTVPLPDNTTKTISFSVSRAEGENVGEYIITPAGDPEQKGYRVLYETGMLTINKAPVTITAGGSKTYGDAETPVVTITGIKNGEDPEKVLIYEAIREEGEDAGTYPITLSGETDQGNYTVTFVRRDENGRLYEYTINRANATLNIEDAEKTFGEDDPPFSAKVPKDSMKRGDDSAVVLTEFDLIREEGENVGSYNITPTTSRESASDTEGKTYYILDNYNVYVETGTFAIKPAELTITVDDAEKTYGEEDPAWNIELDGLEGEDGNGTLSFTKDETTGGLVYIYSVERQITDPSGESGSGENENGSSESGNGETDSGESTTSKEIVVLFTFTVSREAGENVGNYAVTLSGEEVQGNYTLTFESGNLQIYPADLTVTPDHLVKAVGVAVDPLLTATVEGWVFDDGDENKAVKSWGADGEDGTITWNWTEGEGEDAFIVQTLTASKAEDGTITWTYTKRTRGEREEVTETVLLTFTLKRTEGEDEGEYTVTATGDETQSNYHVRFEEGEFSILSVLDIDVRQAVEDYVDVEANPTYNYTATLDLTGTGLDEYSDNGFEPDEHGVPTLSFELPDTGAEADMVNVKTLKVPAGAKLTVTQTASETNDGNYTTTITEDGGEYTPGEAKNSCVLIPDTFHEILFTHSRISFPVSARYSDTQEEVGAKEMTGRKGAMSIPEGEGHTRSVNTKAFAEEMHGKIGFVIPTTMYYDYDHASLYSATGSAIEDGHNVIAIRYAEKTVEQSGEGTEGGETAEPGGMGTEGDETTDPSGEGAEGTETAKTYVWQYSTDGTNFVDAPDGSQLVLFYLPKYVCKIGTEKFNSIKAAVAYAVEDGGQATIEMLIGDYAIRSTSDAVTIPEGADITITTATTEYEGTGTAIISRSLSYPSGHLFYNDGTLTFDTIILDGKSVQAEDALVLNRDENAELTVNAGTTMRNAWGINGGAIYVKDGDVTVDGALTNNLATNGGGAVYVKAGTLTVGATGQLTGNSATTGGAVYVDDGTVYLGGTIGGVGKGNTATSGGAVYISKGTVDVTGSVTGNSAESGGAVYQAGGTLTVSGSMSSNNASNNGGAVYLAGGSLTVEASGSLSGNSAVGNGGAVYQVGGTMENTGAISGNSAANGGGIYRGGGVLMVGGTLSGNTVTENGGGLYTSGGAVTVTGAIGGTEEGAGNSAANGGAIYTSGTTLNLNGASFNGNNASTNGGAIYALNANTVIGGTWSNNTATAGTAASFNGNKATGNGGALYMEGGSVTVMNASSTLNANTADNGGAIYATSGAITVEKGMLQGNEANANGGAIYADSASVTIKGGKLGGTAAGEGNKTIQGNGGAIYSGSGPVTISGGTLAGNSAESGNGGAIYAGSSTVNYTGGNINGGNSAVNGAAIYVGSGIANVSASITGNTATNGGAIGVGGTSARLYFKGNAEVNSNTMKGAQSNVYLDVDSELVVNADSLGNSKKIGIYVPGDVNSEQVVKHGDVTGYFGAYVSAGTLTNIPNVFKSDRFSDLKVAYENNRVYWISELKYDIYWLRNYDAQFPPTEDYKQAPSKEVCSGQTYAPRTRTSDIYDLVMAMKLYEKHVTDFENKVDKTKYASLAVYAYTFSDKAMGNNFENYLKTVRWDGTERKWMYDKQDGTTAPADTTKLVIFYSAPAYLTIVNNNTSNLELDISGLTVLGKDATDGVYGFVTAKNGATVTTLRTLTADDLKLGVGDSIKLMFPGAQGKKFTLKGVFTGEGAGESTTIDYTFNGGTKQTITGTEVDFSDDSFKLNSNDEAAELIFGDALPICKIGNEPFQTLKDAMDYAVAQKASTGSNTYKIEMLVDYLVPSGDVLEIPTGYNITFTTSQDDDFTGSRKKDPTKKGSFNQAILSRDTGNAGASVKSSGDTLTIEKLAFDGRSLTAGGAGGAISTDKNCVTVAIKNCAFTGYRADQGGAIYVGDFDGSKNNANSSLTIEDCDFSNCQTNAAKGDKVGGGGIWTTARKLYVRRCTFDGCACLKGIAQAGSIFHNIQGGWSSKSKTEVEDCNFSNSFAVGGSGGAVESDALDITIQRCSFTGSYTNKSGGSGGAINTYANNAASTGTYCIMRVIDCSFADCSAKNGAAMGGAVRCSTHDLILKGCIFKNTQGVTGGAVAMTNSNAKKVEISGCTFENCIATGNGGAVSAPVGTLIVGVEDTESEDYQDKYLDADKTPKNGKNNFTDCKANRGGGIDNAKDNAIVKMENVDFTRCAARTSNGGALYTQAKELSITGDANTFTDCTGNGSGGAVFQNRNVDGSFVKLVNCTFTGCEANNNGNGGGLYATARTLTINYDTANDSAIERAKGSFVNCTAANAGGGLYHDYAGTVNIANCGFEGCTAKASYGGGLYTTAQTLTITGADSKFKDCTAQTDGGGLYQNKDANGSTFSFKDGSFEHCTATGSYGGAIYTKVKGTVTMESCAIKDSTAKAQGGGIYFLNSNTATFDVCTITGNSVTNSDSKGGGVYIPGGTTTFVDSTVSGCSAAYGGGWYQNNGSLYILSGSINGSATVNGGGLYMNDSNTKVYQYGGTVNGTAMANGGGVYKNNGTYTIGDDTYNGTAYAGASVGAMTVNEGGSPVYTATAVNGGGIYQNGGMVNLNAGASIIGQASANGGGIWNKSTVNQNGGNVTGSAVNGGGVWHTDTTNGVYTVGGGTITGTASENGGAVYQAGKTFTIKTNAVVGERVDVGTDGNEIVITSSAKNGGGLYVAAGTATLSGNGSIEGANATVNGGGAYVAGGTFTMSGGNVKKNTAVANGGGVYYAGGTFTMSGGVIGGSVDDANTASGGAGVFSADRQMGMSGGTITYNHAQTEGGGIAVSGANAKLTFSGLVEVRYNTMGSSNTVCNVYLDQDRNTLINNNALNANSYIGVYASDNQYEAHGQSGMHFGTRADSNNLDCFHNDRLAYLYGIQGSGNLVDWADFVCKITDAEGNLLYKDTEGTPAVYGKLENNSGTGNDSAFGVLSQASPSLYQLGSSEKYSGPYQIQMLVPEYAVTAQMTLTVAKDITLTTASVEEDECGFHFTGDSRFPRTVITRQGNYGGMIYLKNNSLEFTVSDLILDGGSGSGYKASTNGGILYSEGVNTITFTNAILRNSKTESYGGGIRLQGNTNAVLTLNNTTITNCVGGEYGGGISVKAGKLIMNGGSITNCSAKNGGGVRVDTTMEMNGGTITGNYASIDGGGISAGNDTSKLYFSGLCNVTDNTMANSIRCNVEFNEPGNTHIYANGLDGKSEIGVYTPNYNKDNKNKIYENHGMSGKPFGTRSFDGDKVFCFVNDRHTDLRGVESATGMLIVWEKHFLLRVSKAVESDWAYDNEDAAFSFTVEVENPGTGFNNRTNPYGEMTFNQEGKTEFTLKAGESRIAIFPAQDPNNFEGMSYTVKEVLTTGTDGQEVDYTTKARQNGGEAADANTVTGSLGEMLSENENSSGLSDVLFTNTRVTGDLTVSKTVVSTVDSDLEGEFGFTLNLDDTSSTRISKIYTTTLATKDSDTGTETSVDGSITFTNGVATFTLKNEQALIIHDLPTDLPYVVTENLTEDQSAKIRTQMKKDDSVPSYSTDRKQGGKIGESPTTVTEGEGEEAKETIFYNSKVEFTNTFQKIVCKITNRNRILLYYREANGTLQPAIFSHLEDAFDQINSGNLRTSTNGTVSGALRIEMVVPEYAMERVATLNSGKTVTLTTALPGDTDHYPYNDGQNDGHGNVSAVYRSFTDGSMIVDNGNLTLEKITLDGRNRQVTISESGDETVSYNGLTSLADGGIVKVDAAVTLTVTESATLQNALTTGNGGAIWLHSGAILAMNGTIQNCSATNGGGVYADTSFKTITATGSISNCTAINGGAIYASTGTGVTLNAGAKLTGNKAMGTTAADEQTGETVVSGGNGGAVYSEANVTLRGRVGGTGEGEGNTASGSGGGFYMGPNATYIMYAGSEVIGNTAKNGGGLAVQNSATNSTRFPGGVLKNNIAALNGGAVYAEANALVAVSGVAEFIENEAEYGGAIYDGGTLSMTGGSMIGNKAIGKTVTGGETTVIGGNGGAVYVANDKSFTMSGGSITGNRSNEGAVSTGSGAVLTFSGNSVVTDNTGSDGETTMNVWLGYDSNSIITSTGLGANANIGVYVADGEPETADVTAPDYREDHVNNPIYADHGVSGRNFATYTGSSIGSARLNKFVNDRYNTLKGMSGEKVEGSSNYLIAWIGKGLQFKVTQFLIKTDSAGDPVLDENGSPVLSDEIVTVQNATFTFTNVSDEGNPVQVWSGSSDKDGKVSIPWGGNETPNGNICRFAPGSKYILKQTAADKNTVLPAGQWNVTVKRDNSVEWTTVRATDDSVDRTLDITLPINANAVLGETFGLSNDVKPTMTFDVNDGIGGTAKLANNDKVKEEQVAFSTTDTNKEYLIKETNPTWDSHVFKNWATMAEKPTGEEGAELNESELKARGYFEYAKDERITFYRGTDSAEPEVKYAQNQSKGDMTLYAQWEEVVCKITDRNGTLLYINGSPAVYGTLEDGFAAYNQYSDRTDWKYASGSPATARRIEMLVGEYELHEEEGVALNRGKTALLTTALSTDTDGYSYTGTSGTVCTIYRGACDTSMISVGTNLTLTNITLDAKKSKDANIEQVFGDGGIVAVGLIGNTPYTEAILTVGAGATLRNSSVTGCGGAIYAGKSCTVTLSGGTINGNSAEAEGGGVYSKGTVNVTGTTLIDNKATDNGGAIYAEGSFNMAGGTIGNSDFEKPHGNTALNGAGVYINGSGQITGGTISYNIASESGGGIYLTNGDTTMSEGVITYNAAKFGSGVFNNITSDTDTFTMTGGRIIENTASVKNGGAVNMAVGATIAFGGRPIVVDNWQEADGTRDNEQHNVVLDLDDTSVINTTSSGLKDGVIGVYTTDSVDVYTVHGKFGDPFGTFKDPGKINGAVFINDRDTSLYGQSKLNDNLIYWIDWGDAICKLTDTNDNLLYQKIQFSVSTSEGNTYTTRSVCGSAVYERLQTVGNIRGGFTGAEGKLYRDKECTQEFPDTEAVKLKMLRDYTLGSDEIVAYNAKRDLTLTKAETVRTDQMVRNEDTFTYEADPGRAEDPDKDLAKITKVQNTSSMIRVVSDSGAGYAFNVEGMLFEDVSIINPNLPAVNGGAFDLEKISASTFENVKIRGFTTTGNGGAIYLNTGTLTLENVSVSGNSAANGGAAYIANGATMSIEGTSSTPNTIDGNTATNDGAGIYLAQGSTLKISGNPNFGGTDRKGGTGTDKDDLKGAEGNFVIKAFNDTDFKEGAKNGGKDYPVDTSNDGKRLVRQDVYLKGIAADNQPLTSIVLSGNLSDTVPAGSIWVWAEGDDNTQPNHYYMLKQFAVLDSSFSGVVSDATYSAFRNARADADTDCGGDYLTGQAGDNIGSTKCIYWTGGFDFSFMKIDGSGEPVAGAQFKLYAAYEFNDTTKIQTLTGLRKKGDGTEIVGTSANGTSTRNSKDEVLEKGTVLFEKVSPGIYFMLESTVPDGYVKTEKGKSKIQTKAVETSNAAPAVGANPTVYVVLLGETAMTRPTTADAATGTPWANVLLNITPTDITAQTGTGATAKNYAIFKIDPETGKATNTPDIAASGIMNQSDKERKVILKKVAKDTYTPLEGAQFRIFRADLSEVTDGQPTYKADDKNIPTGKKVGDSKGYYESLASGVYFIDQLPEGRYYLVETKIPDSGAAASNLWKVFILEVNDDKQTEIGTEHKLPESTTDATLISNLQTWVASQPSSSSGQSGSGE